MSETKIYKNLITLTKVSDGAPGEPGAPGRDGDKYYIESNEEEILYFYTETSIDFNTSVINFSVYDLPKDKNSQKKVLAIKDEESTLNYNFVFEYLDELGEFRSFLKQDYKDYIFFITAEGADLFEEGKTYTECVEVRCAIEEMFNKRIIPQKNTILRFSYLEEGQTRAIKNLSLREGVHSELAQFNIEATRINAAIQDSKMEFTKDGLKIYGASFEIFDKKEPYEFVGTFDEYPGDGYYTLLNNYVLTEDTVKNPNKTYYEFSEEVYEETSDTEFIPDKDYYELSGTKWVQVSEDNFYYGQQLYSKKDPIRTLYADEGGNLHIQGVLEAATGSFEGEIHATEATFDAGEIGGFNIEAGQLSSKNGELVLNGDQGTIYAKSIVLGADAKIQTSIKLGKAELWNPEARTDRIILLTSATSLDENGCLKIGSITADGLSSSITGNNWSISPDHASFSNINISGSIETTVFKTATTQAVGGAMLFMPSYKIVSQIDNITYELEPSVLEELQTEQSGWLVEGNSYYLCKIKAKDESVSSITIDFVGDNAPSKQINPTVLILIGEIESKPLVLGINSGNNPIAENLITPRGLTITEYGKTGLPNLFLGDLGELGSEGEYTGYGLYSDNVYLNGSLTTKIGEGSYAGVNTLNEAQMNIYDPNFSPKETPNESDSSKIVFWAGASSKDVEDIQKAYFQVSEQGTVYAQRAKLSSSLLVGGEIRGADIYTARIHGDGDANLGLALAISSTSGGIGFQDNEGEITFKINEEGLYTKHGKFIEIGKSEIGIKGNVIKTMEENNFLALLTQKTGEGPESKTVPVLYHKHANQSCGFYFEEGKTSYKINDRIRLSWTENENKNFGIVGFVGASGESNLQYKPVLDDEKCIGYDLFIIEDEQKEE